MLCCRSSYSAIVQLGLDPATAAGIVGPWMIGAVKSSYGSYVVPMLLLAVVNSCAVAYFAVLLLYLPLKKAALTEANSVPESEGDRESLVPARERGVENVIHREAV